MPSRLPTPCRWRGCAETVRTSEGFCPPHLEQYKKEQWEREDAKTKGRWDKNFYHTKQWTFFRKRFLIANPYCKVCGRLANVVDHVHQIRQGGDLLDASNCQPLCETCHNKKRAIESRQARQGVETINKETKWG